MAANSYTFPIQSKIRVGMLEKSPYFVGFFDNEVEAENHRAWLEANVANNAKVGLNIKIQDAGNVEYPRPENLTDVCDAYAEYRYADDDLQEYSPWRKIVIPNLYEGVTPAEIEAIVSKLQVITDKGNVRYANVCQKIVRRLYNVSEGGPATEKRYPVQIP